MYKIFVAVVVLAAFGAVIGQHNHEHGDHDHQHGNCTFNAAKECDLDAHHLHCHDPDDDSIHLCIGDSISIKGKCQQMTCIHHDGDVVLFRGCHSITPGPGCHMGPQDNSKDYPACCPQEIC